MEKKEIVNLFLEKGYFMNEDALDFLFKHPHRINQILEKLKDTNINLISLEVINSFFKKTIPVEVLKEYTKKNQVSIQELHQFQVDRFNKLKEFLERNVEIEKLISINKITTKLKKFSLIVNLVEKDEKNKSLVVEDLTGSTTLYFTSEEEIKKINSGDIIGIKCKLNDGKIFVDKILYPDIPLRRDVGKVDENVNCLFISNLCFDDENFNKKSYENFLEWLKSQNFENLFIFIMGKISSKKEKIIEFFNNLPKNSFKILIKDSNIETKIADVEVNNPSILKIGEVKILVFNNQFQLLNPREFLLTTIKKRYIKLGLMDYFIIDPIPDLFVCGGLNEIVEFNYKGTIFLSTGNFIFQPIFSMINLKSRETIKINFS